MLTIKVGFNLYLLKKVHLYSRSLLRNYCKELGNNYYIPLCTKPRAPGFTNRSLVNSKRLVIKAGNGGSGCIAFQRLFCNPNGGPSGGDGGNGGHVIFKADLQKSDLAHLTTLVQAPNGKNGQGSHCHGSNASHLFLSVPFGTQIYLLKVDSSDTENRLFTKPDLLATLTSEDDLFIAARGGSGGKGNAFLSQSSFFQTFTVKSPLRVAERGAQGESKHYLLRLSKLADLGLVGAPNGGKSTLLRSLTRARPKVAPYPFTTLKPHLGVAKFSKDLMINQLSRNDKSKHAIRSQEGDQSDTNGFVVRSELDYFLIGLCALARVADLPGLIEGAALENKGLGIEFLNLISDCPVLAFVIDCGTPWSMMSDFADKSSTCNELYNIFVDQLTMLRLELNNFDQTIMARANFIVIGTKLDLIITKQNLNDKDSICLLEKLRELLYMAACDTQVLTKDDISKDQRVMIVSAQRGDFVFDLLFKIKYIVSMHKDAHM